MPYRRAKKRRSRSQVILTQRQNNNLELGIPKPQWDRAVPSHRMGKQYYKDSEQPNGIPRQFINFEAAPRTQWPDSIVMVPKRTMPSNR